MDLIKLRAFDPVNKIMHFAESNDTDEIETWVTWENPIDSPQNTGTGWDIEQLLFINNKVEIYENDLLNIYFTSSDGEHIHDCIYRAIKGEFGDLQFKFVNLLWESHGHNQYTSSTLLCLSYKTLDTLYDTKLKVRSLCVPDGWGKNHLFNDQWKENDESNYFKLIGNVKENPELLNGKQ